MMSRSEDLVTIALLNPFDSNDETFDGQSTLNYIALPKGDPSRTLSR
jgi:hypothetical protein